MQPLVEGLCANKTIGKLFELASGNGTVCCKVRCSNVQCYSLEVYEQDPDWFYIQSNRRFQDSPEFQPEILASNPKLNKKNSRKAYTSDEELNSPLTSTIEILLLSPKIVAKGSMNGEHKLDGYGGLIALYKLLCEKSIYYSFVKLKRVGTKLSRDGIEDFQYNLSSQV
ncbi:hypothetical protein Goari_026993 [Gossypium aridum]|uniref:Uncharacterized protein n=1 Tax=Gossypium aridum TaxID=34290 RepID=A0A7J8YSR2_GOSAI|nr:hypothetical protein [Gossypium aridum]